MTEDDRQLWEKVIATVHPLDTPRNGCATIVYYSIPDKQGSTLDLHGMTMQEAHRSTMDFIQNSGGHRSLTIITGKSGQIKREFEHWVCQSPKVQSVALRRDGGSFRVTILKSHRSPSPE